MQRLSLALAATLAFTLAVPAQTALPSTTAMPLSPDTQAIVRRIMGDTMASGQAYEYDRQLADEIGPRLTGSPNYLKAVQWGEAKFKELGLTNVHTETFTTDTWWPELGATGEITAPVQHTLHLWSYGWSPSTPKGGVRGETVYIPSLTPDAIRAMASRLSGKIAFYDADSRPQPFSEKAYFEAMMALEEAKPAAILVGGFRNGAENMGAFGFNGTIAPFPVAQIGAEDLMMLRRLTARGSVQVSFQFTNHTAKAVHVPEVIGEIRGSEKPDEVVIVGGHLDSWNPGTGAQDNGTGSATVVDAAREINSLGKAPKRTMRFILFGGEEQGLVGSTAYAKRHAAEVDTIDAVLITDTGANTPRGWHLMGRTDERKAMANVSPLLSGLGAEGLSDDVRFLFSSDHAAFNVQGIPTLLLWTDSYENVHHKASDTFDAVNRNTLLEGVATVTATAYAIADSPAPFAPHISQPQVEQMLKDLKQWDDYQVLKAIDVVP